MALAPVLVRPPEPYNASNASALPFVDGAAGASRSAQSPRKIVSSKCVDNATRPAANGTQRKAYVPVRIAAR